MSLPRGGTLRPGSLRLELYGAPVVQFPPLRRYFGGWMNSIVMPSASRV